MFYFLLKKPLTVTEIVSTMARSW